jgi:hypothetical protein
MGFREAEDEDMPQVKAAAVVYIKQTLEKMKGNGEARLIHALSQQDAASYRAALPVTWLPVPTIQAIYEGAARILYPGSPTGLRQLGHDSARASYTGVYRMLLRLMTIPYLLEKAALLWKNHHSDGDVTVERISERSAAMVVRSYPTLADPIREVVAGYLAALLEFAGARNPQVKRDDRSTTWRWIVSWD